MGTRVLLGNGQQVSSFEAEPDEIDLKCTNVPLFLWISTQHFQCRREISCVHEVFHLSSV
jgi:hypothetical protein